MIIKFLQLANFRNWENLKLDLAPTTILIGPNGAGKTNIMEAIYLLATGRSWRTTADTETIKWEADFAKIKAALANKKEMVLEMILQRKAGPGSQPKTVKINQVKQRLLDLLGQMPAVLFSPEAIQILDGPPALRRRFLDIMLSETDRHYAINLLEYNKVLKERNRLLFYIQNKKSQIDELEFWNKKLIESGIYLIQKRAEAAKFFNQKLAGDYAEISGKNEKLAIKYQPSAESEKFDEILAGTIESDLDRGSTGRGPHRDDWAVLLNHKDVTTFGSRGEYRSVVLALKMAELAYLGEKRAEKPILLLDDIFSELDADRRKHLAKIVANQQTIITTTDLDHIEKNLREKAKIINLK